MKKKRLLIYKDIMAFALLLLAAPTALAQTEAAEQSDTIALPDTAAQKAQSVTTPPSSPGEGGRGGEASGQAGEPVGLSSAVVSARAKPTTHLQGAENGFTLNRTELFKAACCNLGESFTTNPSVDVSYTDAATGARQIKLLGLAGTYVQMLSENVPDLRGAAAPYALGYVPGPWMQSIQVSKGASSVKNGFESITGQINIEYKKPQAEQTIEANVFANTKSRIEANVNGNIHLTPRLSTALLAHYEDAFGHHDENHDGFLDQANVRQWNVMNRWAYVADNYIFQAAVSGLGERRRGGQLAHAAMDAERYRLRVNTSRANAFVKNAFIFNKEKGTNLALILSGTVHDADALYGHRVYDVTQRTGYASLLFETSFSPMHNLSAGLSINHDSYNEAYQLTQTATATDARQHSRLRETTPGAYAQYTFNLNDHLILMAGLRIDHNAIHGAQSLTTPPSPPGEGGRGEEARTFLTPRFHLKYAPNHNLSFRLSAGKGYRTVHALAENNYLLASNRTLSVGPLRQESAWNYGVSTNVKVPLFGHILDLSAEYYYTRFSNQLVADYDTDIDHIYLRSDAHHGYSHTVQAEATYTFVRGLTATAAFRYNDVRQWTGGRMQEKPLNARYKGLLTVSYKTPLELWQFDVTATLYGGGRLPYNGDDAAARTFSPFAGLNAQVTRWFRHWSIYVGGENLTNYRQRQTILSADRPWSDRFDATQVWGPVHGAVGYIGIRVEY